MTKGELIKMLIDDPSPDDSLIITNGYTKINAISLGYTTSDTKYYYKGPLVKEGDKVTLNLVEIIGNRT